LLRLALGREPGRKRLARCVISGNSTAVESKLQRRLQVGYGWTLHAE
jgi:hypothetical protein